MIRKIIALAALTAITAAAGCAPEKNIKNEDKINVVCTSFAQYDWTRELIKGAEDRYDITLLTETGVDIHSYQPSADDIIKINESDMIIYVGGESDKWVKDYTKGSMGKKVINMLDIVDDDLLYDEREADEHVWLSLDNAEEICEKIAEYLISIDPVNEQLYERNENRYTNELESLDSEYESMVRRAPCKTAVVADRFPFRYMFDEYKINYFAAFPGCSAETEASFETVKLLSEKVKDVPAIIVTDNGNQKLAETVLANAGDSEKPIISLNSMQSVTKDDIDGGMTYLSAMRENLNMLARALGTQIQ